MSQFGRAREEKQQARARQELRNKEASIQPRPAVAVYAVNEVTKEKKLVGVAMSDAGADQLLSTEHSNHPGCKFYAVPTIVLLV